MNKKTYRAYLRTPHWKTVRSRKLNQAGYRCERCGDAKGKLEVHHVTYANLGREKMGDLAVLCRNCHRREHFGAMATVRKMWRVFTRRKQ